MILQVSNIHKISWWKFRRQTSVFQSVTWNMMSYLRKRGWKFFEFFVGPRVVVSKYLEIFYVKEAEYCPFETNWEMSPTYSPWDNLWSISEIADGDRNVSHVSSSSRISLPFWYRLLGKFTNHDDFALTVRYRSSHLKHKLKNSH